MMYLYNIICLYLLNKANPQKFKAYQQNWSANSFIENVE